MKGRKLTFAALGTLAASIIVWEARIHWQMSSYPSPESRTAVSPVHAEAPAPAAREEHTASPEKRSSDDWLGIGGTSAAHVSDQGAVVVDITESGVARMVALPDVGEHVRLTLAPGLELSGNVTQSYATPEASSLGLDIDGADHASLYLEFEPDGGLWQGFVLSRVHTFGYRIQRRADRRIEIRLVHRHEIIPDEMAFPEPADLKVDEIVHSEASVTVPVLESLPGASAAILLDFDGHVTVGTGWNVHYTQGAPIVSAPSKFTAVEIREIWAETSEHFRPFTINVTTSEAAFAKVPARQKMRAVISNTIGWLGQNVGGIAFLSGWQRVVPTPCFIFPGQSYAPFTAQAVSHESGHTLGLSHDGRNVPKEEYYGGHVYWGPIMGFAPYAFYKHWSNGDYAQASNTQDDLGIIASNAGVRVRKDLYGKTPETAHVLGGGPTIELQAVIETRLDVDMFSFTTHSGAITINAVPAFANEGGSLVPRLDLYNESGAILVTEPSPDSFRPDSGPVIFQFPVQAGKYFVAVSGIGLKKVVGGPFSDYGSLGQYTLTISLPASPTPTPTSSSTPTRVATATTTFTRTATPAVTLTIPAATPQPSPTRPDPSMTPSPSPAPMPTGTSTTIPSPTRTNTPAISPTIGVKTRTTSLVCSSLRRLRKSAFEQLTDGSAVGSNQWTTYSFSGNLDTATVLRVQGQITVLQGLGFRNSSNGRVKRYSVRNLGGAARTLNQKILEVDIGARHRGKFDQLLLSYRKGRNPMTRAQLCTHVSEVRVPSDCMLDASCNKWDCVAKVEGTAIASSNASIHVSVDGGKVWLPLGIKEQQAVEGAFHATAYAPVDLSPAGEVLMKVELDNGCSAIGAVRWRTEKQLPSKSPLSSVGDSKEGRNFGLPPISRVR